MAKKKLIKADINYQLDLYDFEGQIDDVVKNLQDKKAMFEAEGWSNINIYIEYWHPDVEVKICGYREETDEEYKKRLNDARKKREENKKQKKEQEEAERKKLRELAKKYPEEVK